MTQIRPNQPPDPVQAAYNSGRRHGLAISALALSIVAFISLLGVEKALLAMTLALLSRRGAIRSEPTRRLGTLAIILNCAYIALFILIALIYWPKLGELLHLMQQLG
jgi:hypothetical protein